MKDLKNILNIVDNKKLLLVFPHPDDESFSAVGVVTLAKKLGFKIILITLTQGGAGKIAVNPHGKSLKEIRVMELTKASNLLGIDKLIIKDYGDAKLKVEKGWIKWLEKEMLKLNPGVVVTYDHTGISGHPDHITVSRVVKKIMKRKEFNKSVLLWPAVSEKISKFLPETLRKVRVSPGYVYDLRITGAFKKIAAVLTHKSQKNGVLKYLIMNILFEHKEWYHKVDIKKTYQYRYINFEI
jgi:LmbE family N-acetylglucosaminyl deacetylase